MDRINELSSGFRQFKNPVSPVTEPDMSLHSTQIKQSLVKMSISMMSKLNSDLCLVPDSIYLCFDFKNSNTKSLVQKQPWQTLTEKVGY